MKKLRFALQCLASLMLAALMPSCSSDPNPVGYLNVTGEKTDNAKTIISLNLSPSQTRVGIDEDAVSSVCIYVFKCNDDGSIVLESHIDNQEVSDNNITFSLDSPGRKIFYAITENNLFDGKNLSNISLADFEAEMFDSSLDKIKTSARLVMSGKSSEINATETKVEGYVPESNNLTINLNRLAAKVQVKVSDLTSSLSELGFTTQKDVYFKVFQTNDKMKLISDDVELVSEYKDTDGSGTYDGYSFDNGTDYILAQKNDFTAENCHYMSENIVANPKSGNTTYVSLRIQVNPKKLWKFDVYENAGSGGIVESDNYSSNIDFYVYAIVKTDDENTILDFLRSGSTIKCYESNKAMQYEPGRPKLQEGLKYVELCFKKGYAYYRINIKDEDTGKCNILRNKFYKINLQSINSLGVISEDYLRPANASSDLDDNSSVSYVQSDAVFSVTDWSDSSQSADL